MHEFVQKGTTMAKPPLKPGMSAPSSGQYREIGPRGGRRREVTVPRGTILPPTTTPNASYNLVDRTDNLSGRKK